MFREYKNLKQKIDNIQEYSDYHKKQINEMK